MQVAAGSYQTCKCKSKSLLVEVHESASDAVCSEKTVMTLCEAAWRRSQWPRGLRRTSATDRLLELRVRIQPGAWMPVSCEPITRRGELYRVWCV